MDTAGMLLQPALAISPQQPQQHRPLVPELVSCITPRGPQSRQRGHSSVGWIFKRLQPLQVGPEF